MILVNPNPFTPQAIYEQEDSLSQSISENVLVRDFRLEKNNSNQEYRYFKKWKNDFNSAREHYQNSLESNFVINGESNKQFASTSKKDLESKDKIFCSESICKIQINDLQHIKPLKGESPKNNLIIEISADHDYCVPANIQTTSPITNSNADPFQLQQILLDLEEPNKYKIDNILTSQKSNIQLSQRKSMHRSGSSLIFDDEYFHEESSKSNARKEKYMNPEMFHKLKDHQVEWSLRIFIEFLYYHLIFYTLLGPFMIIPFYNSRILLRNLSFWGNHPQFYIQSVTYFLNAFILILYFTSDNNHIYVIEIIYMEVVVFLRAYIIACKYATLHPDKIELYRKYVLTGDLTANDFYFARWIFQKDITIYRESYNSMQRGEFDSSLFYLSFFVDPRTECLEEIEQNVEDLAQWHQHENEEFQPKRLFHQEKSVYGYGILSYFLKKFTEKNPNTPLLITSLALALFRGFLLLIFRYFSKDYANQKFSAIETVQMVGLVYNTSFGYFSSFVFLVYFTKDMRMKDYCQKQCLHILSPKRLSLGIEKILPTINFLDPFTLKAWSTLRRVLIDYGKPYYLRLEAFITIYIVVAIASLASLLLWLFKAYNLPGNIGVACGFEFFFILVFLTFILYQGSKVNSNFDKFKNVLIDYRVLFDDLIRLRSYYFMEGKQIKSQNMIRQKTISKIKQQLTQPDGTIKEADILEFINELINCLEDCTTELTQDSINQPFLFFGVKITRVLLQNILVGLGTTTIAIVQYYLSL